MSKGKLLQVTLSESLLTKVEKEASTTGVSKSAFTAMVLNDYFKQESDRPKKLLNVDSLQNQEVVPFLLRMPKSTHDFVANQADEAAISINSYILQQLSDPDIVYMMEHKPLDHSTQRTRITLDLPKMLIDRINKYLGQYNISPTHFIITELMKKFKLTVNSRIDYHYYIFF